MEIKIPNEKKEELKKIRDVAKTNREVMSNVAKLIQEKIKK